MIGDLLDLAAVISPQLSKTWYELANWCYKWGRKSSDIIQLDSIQSEVVSIEGSILANMMPAHTSNEEKIYISNLFSKGLKCMNISEILNTSNENVYTDDKSSISMNQLFNSETFIYEARNLLLKNCKSLTSENIEGLLNEWKFKIKRVLHFQKVSCKSYFTFLKLNDKVEKIF